MADQNQPNDFREMRYAIEKIARDTGRISRHSIAASVAVGVVVSHIVTLVLVISLAAALSDCQQLKRATGSVTGR